MCFVLLNMMCSKRCAKPLRDSGSSFEPTWYQTWIATVGLESSRALTTVIPFGSVRTRYASLGTRTAAAAGGAADGAGCAASGEARRAKETAGERGGRKK